MKTREKPEGYSINYSSVNLTHMNMTKWSVKEKLYLISSILMNGDSNWTKICHQLNKCMKFTSTFYTFQTSPVLRTNNQCLKQYKFLVKSYTNRHGTSDLKKIYNELTDERLKELKSIILENNENFTYICKEIEQILAMDSPNFDELVSIWKVLKNEKQDSKKETTTSDIIVDEDEKILERDLEKLFIIKQRQREREEALALEQQKLLEIEKAKEAEIKKREEEAIQQQLLQKDSLADSIKSNPNVKEKWSTEVKIESSNTKEEELFDKIRDLPNNNLEISLESNKISTSGDEINKSQNDLSKEISGIEWKPLIDNITVKNTQDVVSDANRLEHNNDKEINMSQNSSPDSTFEKKPRRTPRVIDSSPSQSSGNGSTSDNDESETKRKKIGEKAEIIFAPMINYDKKEDNSLESKDSNVPDKSIQNEPSKTDLKTAENEVQILKNTEIEDKSSKPEQESKPLKTTSGNKKDKDLEADILQISGKSDSPKVDEKGEKELTGRSGSLRSSSKNRISNIAPPKRQNSTSKPLNLVKETEEDQGQIKSNNLLTMINRIHNKKISSSDQLMNSDKEPEIKSSDSLQKPSDTGLLSIIKTEPVQLSATSTISPTEQDKDLTNSDLNLSISTRSIKNQEAVQAPFSSSSTSSSLSNNSISSKFEDEKAYRSWKKSIMMTLNNITCHKHATIFMQPVRDEIAPGYSSVVFRPMDLTTVKKNIETGVIKSTKVFQRDVMLMFTNAIMYNSSNHDVHKISIEMYREVLTDIEQLLNAQENKIDDDVKQIRGKDKRSSTNSDRSVFITGNDNESVESETLIGLHLKSTRKSSLNYNKEETNETESIKSSSSIQTVTNARNKSKPDKLSSPNLASFNTKKRRPSSSETNQSKKEEPNMLREPKPKKRRRSGR